MTPAAPGPRAPRDLRWIRSGNDILHAVPLRTGSTVCGLRLRRIEWSSYCGPGVPRLTLERAEPPICKHCLQIVQWEEPEGSEQRAQGPQGPPPGANSEQVGLTPADLLQEPTGGPQGSGGAQ